jgi:hypothetical protein
MHSLLAVAARIVEREGNQSATFHAGTRALRPPHVPDVSNTSHVVTAQVVVPDGGARGVIRAQGGRYAGWTLYCLDGLLTYCHNIGAPPLFYLRGTEPLTPGAHELRYEFAYDGDGPGKGGAAALFIDEVQVALGRLERTIRTFIVPDCARFDVGVAPCTTVTSEIPVGDNAFTGEIHWVRIETGDRAESAEEREAAALAAQ